MPDSTNSIGKNNSYRYEVKIRHENFMEFSKENNATPSIAVGLLISKAIKRVYPKTDKPIMCNIASDLRNGTDMDNTFRNCVGSISLPYSSEFEKLPFKDQAVIYRKMIKEYKNTDNLKREVNKMTYLSDKLDKLPSYEAKKEMLSFFNNLVTNTFILSYVGQTKLGECEKYIDSFHTYTSGTNGLAIQMLSVGDYITIDFIQSFESDKYIKAFARVLEEIELDFSISDIIKFTIPRDSINLEI